MSPRYLTKSRFTLACQCPTKLYYTGKRDYANQSLTDSFLAELAKGGYQVGELAKCYHPGGVDITTLDYEEALSETNALLRCENAIIYEAAVAFSNLFIRVDVLVKQGTVLNLIEVKAKSFDPDHGEEFLNRDGTIRAPWRPYLYDVAFQKYVLTRAFPDHTVIAYLMLSDKTAGCPTDGLNQKFRIVREQGDRLNVRVAADLSAEDLTPPILGKVNVDEYVEMIWSGRDGKTPPALSFNERITLFADHYERDEKLPPRLSSVCKSCEFHCTPEDEAAGLKNGLQECWSEVLGWTKEELRQPTVLDLWSYRKKDALIEQGRFRMRDLLQSDVHPRPDGKPGLSTSERQWLQIRKVVDGDNTAWLDREHLRKEIDGWTFPLHCIDFETTTVAIPFNKGRHPYEEIAFQFSHHLLHEDGRVEHAGEYINVEPGVFPNYDFVRDLKRELEGDDGVIFRYAAHENTYLCKIDEQLCSDTADIPDREELRAFIRSISHSTGGSREKWHGERCMIDMLDLVKRYFYHPSCNGSNSIKYVLPAVLDASTYLQNKYGRPVYGAEGGIRSLNFRDWQWIRVEEGSVLDPYLLLPRLFEDIPEHDARLMTEDPALRDGGAAMTAYARMQFEEMSDYERAALRSALLKYCELDTLAMVMICEYWIEEC